MTGAPAVQQKELRTTNIIGQRKWGEAAFKHNVDDDEAEPALMGPPLLFLACGEDDESVMEDEEEKEKKPWKCQDDLKK